MKLREYRALVQRLAESVSESILLDEVSRERASAELKQRASELEQAYISGAGDGSDELDCAPLFGSVRAEYGRIVNTHSLSDLTGYEQNRRQQLKPIVELGESSRPTKKQR